jgi:hypothetical protein
MKPIDELKELALICWSTLLVGLQKGWVTKSDIADYATKLLSKGIDNNEDIAVLANADFYDDLEVKELMLRITNEPNFEAAAVEKWRLAILLALNKSILPEEEKIDKLQELYAEFDYPEDMFSCSIYSQDTVDPLAAMVDVISSLKKKFNIE